MGRKKQSAAPSSTCDKRETDGPPQLHRRRAAIAAFTALAVLAMALSFQWFLSMVGVVWLQQPSARSGLDAVIDSAVLFFDEGRYHQAVHALERLNAKHPKNLRVMFHLARALDQYADEQRNNELLERSFAFYLQVMRHKKVSDSMFVEVGDRLAERLSFRGWSDQAIDVRKQLCLRFPKDLDLLNKLGVEHLVLNDIENARHVFEAVIRIDPSDGHALAHLAFILKTVDLNFVDAVKYFSEAFKTTNTSVHQGRFYYHFGEALQRLDRREEANKVFEEGARRGLFLKPDQRSLYNVPGLKAQPFWSIKETGFQRQLHEIARNWRRLRDEAMSMLSSDGLFRAEEENLRHVGDWKQLTLWQAGHRDDMACSFVPTTCRIIEEAFPEATECRRGQIKFSIMHPGTHIHPHTGPTNCRLRAHLGLKVPKKDLLLRVANATRVWKEGEWLIFDDSFEHEVWQDADTSRLILILDFWHPHLTEQERRFLPSI